MKKTELLLDFFINFLISPAIRVQGLLKDLRSLFGGLLGGADGWLSKIGPGGFDLDCLFIPILRLVHHPPRNLVDSDMVSLEFHESYNSPKHKHGVLQVLDDWIAGNRGLLDSLHDGSSRELLKARRTHREGKRQSDQNFEGHK